MRITLESIRAKAADRPAGYFEEVMAAGTVIGDVLDIDQAELNRLAVKYAGKPVVNESVAVPHMDWPLWAKALAFRAIPEDRGIGDVIARTVGPIGGDAFKKWFKTIFGADCGCDARQEGFNLKWPLIGSKESFKN